MRVKNGKPDETDTNGESGSASGASGELAVAIPEGATPETVQRMARALTAVGYTPKQAEAVIEAAYQGARESDTTDLDAPVSFVRSSRVLIELLTQLGVDRGAAGVAVAVMQHLDFTKVTFPTRVTSDLLDIEFRRLKMLRDERKLKPWILHETEAGIQRPVVYGAHRILHAAAWRDLNPYRGGYGMKHLPPRH